MRKSSLRFLCGTSFLLIVSVCVLVPQIRMRLVPMLTRLTIDPGLSIGDIRLHAGGSIVEMKQLSWRSTDQDRVLALSAKEVWLALDTQPLLERRMIFPRAFINEANLDLRDERIAPVAPQTIWEQRLAARVAELDWNEIKSHFNSLLAADDLHDRWYARLQAWMERSKALATRAGALGTHVDHADNPLRLEGEVTSKLDQLQQLSDEQSTLSSQFVSVEKMLDSEAKQLRKKLDSENQLIASIIAERAQDSNLIEIVSLELVNWAANRSWQRVADFSEVSDRLLRAATSDRSEVLPAVNLNLRASSQPTFQVSELQASGMFSSASGTIPYHVVSHCRQLPKATPPMHWTGWARFEFQLSDSRMQLLVDQRPQQPGVCKIQVIEQPTATLHSAPLHRLVLASDGHSLEGRFSLLSNDLQAAFGIQDESEIELSVSGSWKQPEFQPTTELPAWLRELAVSKIDDSFARAREIVQSELRRSFEMRINKLQTLVAIVVRDGATASAAHQQQIASVMTRMQQQLDASQGIEFARRPATPEPDITR